VRNPGVAAAFEVNGPAVSDRRQRAVVVHRIAGRLRTRTAAREVNVRFLPAHFGLGEHHGLMLTAKRLLVQAISPERLAVVRAEGTDGHGNQLQAFAASGQGEPLRCCLRYARAGEQIALMSYAPFDHPSVWTEVGPVYVHAASCAGYPRTGTLPDELRTGPRVLRAYERDDTMNYDHNTVVTDDADLEPVLVRLLGEPDVSTVHVRTLAPQCFLYAVTGG
jgi:hypothetical protein